MSFITCNHTVYMLIYSSLQINLPESVSKRYLHSIAPYQISNNRVWIIVNGGKTNPVTRCDVTIIVELGMIINIM